jgi:hypothetical protein
MSRFDGQVLDLLARQLEVEIETVRLDGRRRRTIIWVMVDDGDVFVRSVRGDRGYWYQAVLDRPHEVTLIAAGQRIPVSVEAAADDDSIARCDAALRRKYTGHGGFSSMFRPNVLHTTLRVEPRGP